jgi:hypothetical protein
MLGIIGKQNDSGIIIGNSQRFFFCNQQDQWVQHTAKTTTLTPL